MRGGSGEGQRAVGGERRGSPAALGGRTVDFVVVGLGLGAVGVLLGLVLWDIAPRRWQVPAAPSLPATELARRIAWARALRTGGRLVALGGFALWVATLLALATAASDRGGALVVVTSVTLLTAGGLVWVAAYARRYHPRPRRSGARRTPSAPSTNLATSDAPDATEDAAATVAVEIERAAPTEAAARAGSGVDRGEATAGAGLAPEPASGEQRASVAAGAVPPGEDEPEASAGIPEWDSGATRPAAADVGDRRAHGIDSPIATLLPVGKAS